MKHKLATPAVLVLTVLFNRFFMFTKHDGFVSPIVPFANDPYDAIGSIAMIVMILLSGLCLFRTYWLGLQQVAHGFGVLFLERTQFAIAVSVLVVLGYDILAMLRHPSVWMDRPATTELVALVAGLGTAAVVVLTLLQKSAPEVRFVKGGSKGKRAGMILLGCIAALAFYPENIIRSAPLHFLTILVGFVLFFAPVSCLTVLMQTRSERIDRTGRLVHRTGPGFALKPWMQWGAMALLGILTGAFALLGEMFGEGSGGDGVPLSRMLIVVAVFLGSGTSGLLLAFAFLRKPLGLFRKVPN